MKEYIVQAMTQKTIDSFDAHNAPELIRCKDCVYAENTMFDNEYNCYFDEENESGCKRLHKGDWFCADGEGVKTVVKDI